jgi:hypothetical protein
VSWAKLDDRASENAKQLRAGAKACWLWACGLMYANRQLQKTGSIPKELIPAMFPGVGKREAKRLVEVGLWHDEGNHYQIHDYHGWNPELRAQRSEAGRKGGLRSGEARRKQSASDVGSKVLPENEASPRARALDPPPPPPPPPLPLREEPSVGPPAGDRSQVQPPDEKPKRKRKAPSSPLPADFAPSDEHKATARLHGLDLDLELQKFRAHAEATDRRQVRWNATFRQWLLSAATYRPRAVPPVGQPAHGVSGFRKATVIR